MAKPATRQRVKNRGLFGDIGKGIKDGVQSIGDAISSIGTTDVTKTVAFPITVSKPGVTTNIVNNKE